MKNYQKYATNAVILPPPPEAEEEVDVPVDPNDMESKWFDLRQRSEDLDPLTEKPSLSEEQLLEQLMPSTIPPYEKELLHNLNLSHPEKNIGQDAVTQPPPKKAQLSTDSLVKVCSKFYDLCSKF